MARLRRRVSAGNSGGGDGHYRSETLYSHHAEALAGRRQHPALRRLAIWAPSFSRRATSTGMSSVSMSMDPALVVDTLDLHDWLIGRRFQHAVIAAAHPMAKIHRTAKGGSPEAGGLVHVCGFAVDENGA